MTVPPLSQPIILQQPGVGDALQQGLAPLLTMLQHRREMSMKQRALEQDQQRIQIMQQQADSGDANIKSQIKDREAGIEDKQNELVGHNAAAAIYMQLSGGESGKDLPVGSPERELKFHELIKAHIGKPYHAAMMTEYNTLVGNQQKVEEASTKQAESQRRTAGEEKVAKVSQAADDLIAKQGRPLDVQQKIEFLHKAIAADLYAPNVGALTTMVNTLEQGLRQKTTSKIIKMEDPIDHKVYNTMVDGDGNQTRLGLADQGPARNLQFRIDRYKHGTATERRTGALAERAYQVHQQVVEFENNNIYAASEAMAAIVSGRLPWVGKGVQMGRAAFLSPEGRIAYALYNDFLEVSLPMMHGLRVVDAQRVLSENAHFPTTGEFDPRVMLIVQQNRMRLIETGLESGPPGGMAPKAPLEPGVDPFDAAVAELGRSLGLNPDTTAVTP